MPDNQQTTQSLDEKWTQYAHKHLVGRKITNVRYLSQEEADNLGWGKRCVVLHLNDGSLIFPSKDDAGNDAGTLFGQGPPDDEGKAEDITCPTL